VRVVVPRVAAPAALGARVELGLLLGERIGVEMGRREQRLSAGGMEVAAGRLAVPGREALLLAAAQVEGVDLEEGVARLALALETSRRPSREK